MAAIEETRPKVLRDVDKTLDLSRFNTAGSWSLLLLIYIPFGLILTLLRICMSLQAVLLLLLFPEGTLKRYLLRISFAVLGIVVTTQDFRRKGADTKVFVTNRLSWVDHLVLHLAFECVTVSTHGRSPPLSWLFSHQTLEGKDEGTLQTEARRIPEFDESVSVVDFTPHVIQPEFMPTNGSHMLLQFSSWPFALDSTVQPMKLSAWRPFGIKLTTAKSSGCWDLLWTICLPCTVFHVKMLPSLECEAQEMPQEFARRVQYTLAREMGIQGSEVTQEDVKKWLADPPRPAPPPPPPPPQPKGPVFPESEFTPSTISSSSSSSSSSFLSSLSPPSDSSPEMETMVQQVTAVLPQVPHTTIRKDLLTTDSVDLTITNLLEGKVEYEPIATFQQSSPSSTTSSAKTNSSKPSPRAAASFTATASKAGNSTKKTPAGSSPPFSGITSPALASMQRQLSLEERKRDLIEQAKRCYIEKHGLS